MKVQENRKPEGIEETKVISNVNINNSSQYSQDKKPMLKMPIFSEMNLNRLNDNGKLGTENISSGFGSGHDATDSDFDIFNMMNNASTCLQNINNTVNYHSNLPNIGFDFSGNGLCSSKFSNIKSRENLPNDLNIKNHLESNVLNESLWDMERKFEHSTNDISNELSTTEIFNIDNEMNIPNLITPDNTLFQSCLFDEKIDPIRFEKNNYLNSNFPLQHCSLNTSMMNQEVDCSNFLSNNCCSLQNTSLNQNMDSQYLNDSSISNMNDINNSFNQFFHNLNGNDSNNNQNVIVRVLQNGQLHFASIDQNVLQQMLLNNQRSNFDSIHNQSINNQPLPDLTNGTDTSIQKNIPSSAIHKSTENFDLMENPANWRRIPNNGGYQCNICNKCYTRKYGLKIHLRIHSGFKPLECKVCKKKFGDPSNMAKHIRLHSTEGSPYKCNLCNKPLVRRRDLERHMRSRHPDCLLKSNIEPYRKTV